MRGVALVVAVTVVAEVGDFRRFANARQRHCQENDLLDRRGSA